jgi:acetyl-CoA decarbonylase/synthase complex subunit delta
VAYEEPTKTYAGEIREVVLGPEDASVTVGGAKTLPFYAFDGADYPAPAIAMEVYDAEPEGWPEEAIAPFADVAADPVTWATKCEKEYGADMVCVQLASTDPNGTDASPEDAGATVKAVADAVGVPVVVYGSGDAEKDGEVLKKVAESCDGKNLLIGPATEDNYKPIVAAALGYNHRVIGESPIDVNMAKQLNILMTQLGLDADRVVMDPSVGAVGYGIEYAYSVMERLRLAALAQDDDMTRMPMICNVAKEVWRAKEARAPEEEAPEWGDAHERGVLWEGVTAFVLALSGAEIIVMRHPEAVALLREALSGLGASKA